MKYLTLMSFMDVLAMSFEAKKVCPRLLTACVMYVLIGGKDIMCAFQTDYQQMPQEFSANFPIPEENTSRRLPEGILFYNQIIEPFFLNEFGYYLSDLRETLKFVIKFFTLNIDDNRQATQGLIEHCRHVLQQNYEISLEKVASEMGIRLTKKEFSERDVFENLNEFYSYQTYNSFSL